MARTLSSVNRRLVEGTQIRRNEWPSAIYWPPMGGRTRQLFTCGACTACLVLLTGCAVNSVEYRVGRAVIVENSPASGLCRLSSEGSPCLTTTILKGERSGSARQVGGSSPSPGPAQSRCRIETIAGELIRHAMKPFPHFQDCWQLHWGLSL